MGFVFAEVTLSNPRREELVPIAVRALADAGALTLCIPEHVAVQLQLEAETMREVFVADEPRATATDSSPERRERRRPA